MLISMYLNSIEALLWNPNQPVEEYRMLLTIHFAVCGRMGQERRFRQFFNCWWEQHKGELPTKYHNSTDLEDEITAKGGYIFDQLESIQ